MPVPKTITGTGNLLETFDQTFQVSVRKKVTLMQIPTLGDKENRTVQHQNHKLYLNTCFRNSDKAI